MPESDIRRTSWWETLKRTVSEFLENALADWAAALTYYGLLSLFPALIALVSLIGLFADPREATRTITEIIAEIGPESAAETFTGPIRSITSNREASGILFVLGLLGAMWSASAYVGAFIRASNVIYETREGRSFWKLQPLRLLITLAGAIVITLVAAAIVLTGPIVDAVAEALGIGETAKTIWDTVKWPVLVCLLVVLIGILYYASPNVKLRGLRWVTPGSIVAVAVWLLASGAFAIYVSRFGSFDKTYGTLGGVIVLLIWMWIGNLAILFGHQLNAERERSLEIEEGRPRAEAQIQLPYRDEPDDGRGSRQRDSSD
jgi:membrane protein